jgi:AcrR family transcriptional regulator
MLSTTEIKIADTALRLLGKNAWRDLTLAQVAKAAKVSLVSLQDLRGGKSALVGLVLGKIGAETAKRYKPESRTARERLFDVALAWFETNATRKPAIRSLYEGLKYDPITVIEQRNAFISAARWLMTLAEADTGSLQQARALALAAVMIRAIPIWLKDDSELTATMAGLDRDLARVSDFTRARD